MAGNQLVSVIIPTYNRAELVCRAIDSALGQTYENKELIVVDDGSTDDTRSRLGAYHNSIRVLTQDNSGPSVARNRGIEAARGEIVAFLDSDDYWLPTKLQRQVDLLERLGSAVPCCLCNCSLVYPDGRRTSTFEIARMMPTCAAGLWTNPAEVLWTRSVIFNQAVAIRREFLERSGSFDQRLPFYCEDHELSLRLALEGPWAIIRDELVVCQFASPDGLGLRALRDELRLRENQLDLRKRAYGLLKDDISHAKLRRIAKREIRQAGHHLAAARLSHRKTPVGAAAARLLRGIARVRQALFRRSPLYPRMIVEELS